MLELTNFLCLVKIMTNELKGFAEQTVVQGTWLTGVVKWMESSSTCLHPNGTTEWNVYMYMHLVSFNCQWCLLDV